MGCPPYAERQNVLGFFETPAICYYPFIENYERLFTNPLHTCPDMYESTTGGF